MTASSRLTWATQQDSNSKINQANKQKTSRKGGEAYDENPRCLSLLGLPEQNTTGWVTYKYGSLLLPVVEAEGSGSGC